VTGLTHRTAWRAGAIEALGTRVRPAFRRVTPPVTIDPAGLRRTALSAPITGTSAPGARLALAVGGALVVGAADPAGAWSLPATVADVGGWPVAVWQVTDRGIHAPATATLVVRPVGATPELDHGGIYRTSMSPVVVTGDGVPGGEVEIEIGDLSPWLLAGGVWNDAGAWSDAAVWED